METQEKQKRFSIIEEKKLEKSTVEFEVEIPALIISDYRNNALKKLSDRADIDGFRKGHVPESVLVKKLGEMTILEEAAEEAVNDIVPLILAERKINFISQPQISIIAIAPNNPLRFKIKVAYLPEINLPDYKKIAADKNKTKEPALEIEPKEIDDAIEQIRKISAKQLGMEKDKLPEINDEFVKKLGDFPSVENFKNKLKIDMLKEKELRSREKKRLDIAENILAEIKLELPDVLLDYELDRMEAQFASDLEGMGMKLDDYLQKIRKTKEDLRKEWGPDAEKRAKMEIVIHKIASTEKIGPTDEEIKHETEHLLEHHKDADRSAVERYIERALINQKVFEFLENQK